MIKIYLSSTHDDLEEYRQAVYHTLRQMREDVIAMEDYVATDQPPVAKCLADVADADIYLGCFAWHYGFIPPDENPENRAITELEYREAVARGKPRFIFLLAEGASWPPIQMDFYTGEGERGERIKALRDELRLKETISFFHTPGELASLVSVAISNWIKEKNEHEQKEKRGERTQSLKAMMVAEQEGLLDDRLKRFVGREKEISALQSIIQAQQQAGGYVILTGLAGQGKSSIIAKMIENQGRETSAYHFIQFGVGREYQINILRDLMARLLLKYDLPERYVAGESYQILRNYFSRMLNNIAEKGKREVIYIDGLDQLETGSSASPDLSFLPLRLPPGIVIVVGTRPNETLRQVLLHARVDKPYELPGLSRDDFALLLQHHEVRLPPALGDSLYQKLNQSPLYLDLVARELHELRENPRFKPEALIAQIANNPDDIFTFTFSRIRELPEWRKVTRPMLGILLVAQEPLTAQQIAHICQKENDRIRAGITRLGGLLVEIGQQKYALFHPKLNEYLAQDTHAVQNEIQFDSEEIEALHGQVAQWCEQGSPEQLWQALPDPSSRDDYREYARHHYITHLYKARRDTRLFTVLNDGQYEQGKLRFDRSTRSTAADIQLGCQAAAHAAETLAQGKTLLSHLWRYTLLRINLTTRADTYPLEAFQALLALRKEREAFDLAELLTQPAQKLAVLILLTEYRFKQSGAAQQEEGVQLYTRVCEIAMSIEDKDTQTTVLGGLITALLHAGQLERAQSVAEDLLDGNYQQAKALYEISDRYGKQEHWKQAEEIARSIPVAGERVNALSNLAVKLKLADEREKAETLWQEASTILSSITDRDQYSRAMYYLSSAFTQAKEWERATTAARSIECTDLLVSAWCQLALSSAQERLASQAKMAWAEAEAVIKATTETDRDQAYKVYAIAQVQADSLSEAETIARRKINGPNEKIAVLSSLASHLVKKGLWEDSKRIIKLIVEEYSLTDVKYPVLDTILIRLAIALAREKQWDMAKEIAYTIPRKEAQCRALMGIVSELARAGQSELAQEVWEEASAMCTAQMDAIQRDVAAMLVATLVEVGRIEQARKIMQALPDEQARAYIMGELAIVLARTGQIAEAEKIANETANSQRKVQIQKSIAVAQLKAGQYEQAITTAQSIPRVESQSQALAELVTACCQNQQWDRAQEIAQKIQSGHLQAEAQRRIVVGLVRDGQRKKAEDIVRAIHNAYDKANAWCDLTTTFAQIGGTRERAFQYMRNIKNNNRIQKKAECNIDLAARSLGLNIAASIARDIDPGDEKEEALCNVAVAYAHEKQWNEAEKLAEEISKGPKRDEAWATIARELAQAGQWTQAVSALHKVQESKQRIEVLQAWGIPLANVANNAIREQIMQHLNESREQASLFISIADTLAQAKRYLDLTRLTQQAWLQASTKGDCQYLFAMIKGLLPDSPEMRTDFSQSFQWVDTFIQQI